MTLRVEFRCIRAQDHVGPHRGVGAEGESFAFPVSV
jgi:hypothetical protein